jgi:hypothetical protein
VAATEYLDIWEGHERPALISLRNRALQVVAQRLTTVALDANATGQPLPIATIVALVMAQVYGFVTRCPEQAKEFFDAIDDTVIPPEHEAQRQQAAEALAEGAGQVLASMRMIERAIREQAVATP